MNLKKILIILAGLVLAVVITGFFLVMYPFIGTKKHLPLTEFAGGKVTGVFDGMSQVLILDGGNGQIGLIDAGATPEFKTVIDALAARGYKPADVKAIFLSHGHPDHIAAAKIFTNAKLHAMKQEVPIAEGLSGNNSPANRLFSVEPTGLKVNEKLADGQRVKFGALDIDVFSVPGHTPGSAVYLVSGVLFMGDTALSSNDGKILSPVWFFSTDVDQGRRSLRELVLKVLKKNLQVDKIVFSHSGELDGLQPLIDFSHEK